MSGSTISPARRSAVGGGTRLSRRGALVAVPTALALAGCRWGPEDGTAEVPVGTTPPPPDADRAVVDEAVEAIVRVASLVAATATARPGLAEPLAGFATLHEAHLRHLDARAEIGAAGGVKRLDGVLRVERELQDALIALADRSSSGVLARSLASMAAGVAQHVAVASGAAS